jgi:hypothetical protein
MTDPPTLWTRFRGGWCDNCRTAYSYMPVGGRCPHCNAAGPARPAPISLRPATITVEPDDDDDEGDADAPPPPR